jgi:hypothetical protein
MMPRNSIEHKNQAMSEKADNRKIKKRGKWGEPRSVSEIVGKVLEPVLARRAGMTLDLMKAWPELVGEEFQETTRPEKINWPRRSHEDDPFKPAALVVACENSVALFFQHEQAAVLERVNVYFGFEAIGRITIVQKQVLQNDEKKHKSAPTNRMTSEEQVRLESILDEIDDPRLKETLEKLGKGVILKSGNTSRS